MIRTCPHCQHTFDPGASPPAECPACHRQFTVSDWSANATLEFDVPPVGTKTIYDVQATVDDIPLPADGDIKTIAIEQTIELPSLPRSANTVADQDIGMTVQQEKWHPSAEEIAAAMTQEQIDQTSDIHLTPNNLRDMTILWGDAPPPDSVGLSNGAFQTADSSLIVPVNSSAVQRSGSQAGASGGHPSRDR